MTQRMAVLTAVVWVACGKPIPGPGDSGSGGGSGALPCPAVRPAPSSACPSVGLFCEYGTDIRPNCRSRGECTNTGWLFTEPACQPLPTVTCPATRDVAHAQACSPVDAFCDYNGLLCQCTNCVKYPVENCSGPLKWSCQAPNSEPSCPAAPPRLGDACSSPNTTCTYACDDGRKCIAGAWQPWTPTSGCPVSSRQSKEDIHYLGAEEREALSRRVLSTPLASYRYRDLGSTSPRRLGFIIEDDPTRFSVAPDQKHVDLYGYVSELLATVQVQQAQIEELRREIDRLKANARPAARPRPPPGK